MLPCYNRCYSCIVKQRQFNSAIKQSIDPSIVDPGTPHSVARTPMGMGAQHTPRMRSVDPAAIQRAAAGLPSSLYNTLAQVTGGTPGGGYPTGSYGAGYPTGYNYQVRQRTHSGTQSITRTRTLNTLIHSYLLNHAHAHIHSITHSGTQSINHAHTHTLLTH